VALKLISLISSERREDGRAAAKKLARTQRTPLFESQITKSGVQLDGDGTLHHFWRVAGKTHCSNSRTQLNFALIPEKTCDMETFSFVPLSLGGGARHEADSAWFHMCWPRSAFAWILFLPASQRRFQSG
jgi:hypothetical protein